MRGDERGLVPAGVRVVQEEKRLGAHVRRGGPEANEEFLFAGVALWTQELWVANFRPR